MGLTKDLGALPRLITISSDNNVGINNTLPGNFRLDVSGTTRISGELTLNSTISNGQYVYTLPGSTGVLALTSQLHNPVTIGSPANGLSLSGQVLSLALSGPTTRGALTSEDYNYFFDKVQGNGDQNYLPKYIFSGSGKQIGNSQIYDNGTNVLIGTTTNSGYKLDVNGTGRFSGSITSITSFRINKSDGSTLGATFEYDSAINQAYIYNHVTGGFFSIYTNGSERLQISSTGVSTFNGNIQIINSNVLNLGYNQGGGATLKYNSNGNLDITPRSGYNTIFTSGNVGIGTTSPAAKLSVNGDLFLTSTGRSITFNSDTNLNTQIYEISGSINLYTGGQDRMRITSGGNVGIGTTSPGTTTANTLLGFVNGSNIQARTAVPQIAMSSNIDGDWYAPTYKTTGPAAQIIADGYYGNISFRTAPSGTAGNAITWNGAAIYIQNDSKVGIGTTSPSSKLHLYLADGANDNVLKIQQGTNAYASGINLVANNDGGAVYNFINSQTNGGTEHWRIGGGATNSTMAISTGGTERMRVTSNGELLIGRTSSYSAGWQLAVEGNIYAKYDIRADGGASFGGNLLIGTTTDNGNKLQVAGRMESQNFRKLSLALQTTPQSLGLPINAYSGGSAYLLLISTQFDAGNGTGAALWMIRCGYNGNNFEATQISVSNTASGISFSQVNGILHISGNTNWAAHIQVISNNLLF